MKDLSPGELYDVGIPVLIGIWFTLAGYRIIGKNPKNDKWFAMYGPIYRVGGPFLIVLGVLLLVLKLI